MKLSVKVEYACRVLAHLAGRYGSQELLHIEHLAEKEEVPANYLVQILSELRNGGLIISRRGKQGGYALARSPDTITLYDIVIVIEGDLIEMNTKPAGISGPRVTEIWEEVRKDMETKTKSFTLDTFVAKENERMFYI
ncbi:MAG: Rrf2 family transcriptional regulator [Verrucomicrobia bacterium]|nr:MAG: Rrf2 family transcriptional regulator [Verrucomicrobiota bacterium]